MLLTMESECISCGEVADTEMSGELNISLPSGLSVPASLGYVKIKIYWCGMECLLSWINDSIGSKVLSGEARTVSRKSQDLENFFNSDGVLQETNERSLSKE